MAKPRIMVVDDDAAFRRLMAQVLHTRYLVLPAEDGVDALKKSQEIRPDAILLDLSMPGQNGLDTLSQIRNTKALEAIPVIVVTADSRRDTVYAMLNAGANDYVLKSSVAKNRDRLFQKIERLLNQSNLPLMA